MDSLSVFITEYLASIRGYYSRQVLVVNMYFMELFFIAAYVMLPMLVLFGTYCIRIFTQFYIYDNIYLFLKPVKAVFLVAMIAGAGIYIAFIQERLPDGLKKKLPWIYAGAWCSETLYCLSGIANCI